MKKFSGIFRALVYPVFLLLLHPGHAEPILPDNQSISRYCHQISLLLESYGRATTRFTTELDIYREARRRIQAGSPYPYLQPSGHMERAYLLDSTHTYPPFSDSLTRTKFTDLTGMYRQVMFDCLLTQSWLSNHTSRGVYSLSKADSAVAILDQELRYLHMLHGELTDALYQLYFDAIESSLHQSPCHASLVQMKTEIQSSYRLVQALDEMQLGSTIQAVASLQALKQHIAQRDAHAPDMSLNPVFSSYDYILRWAFLPKAETLLLSCEAGDYEYLNQFHRSDIQQLIEAHHALTDQFSYETLAWTPYEQEPGEVLDQYFTAADYPTAPPSTLKQMPLTKEASSEAR